MLNNIQIRFNRKDFEYDVYSLVKAFYPQSQVEMFYGDEKEKGEYELVLLVTYGDQEICVEAENDKKVIGRQRAAVAYEKGRKET